MHRRPPTRRNPHARRGPPVLMRAVVLRAFGPPERLVAEDHAEPQPGPGQLVVDVQIAGVTFVETQIRAGRPPHPSLAPALPIVLGNGVGGVVPATGQRVVTTTGGSGGYAERVAVDASVPIVVPETLDLATAVALLADGRTALSLMQSARVQPGETVLVEAAGGGVGSLLVQLARDAGAHVIAAAGSERKLALARTLGAAQAVDYTGDGWAEEAGPVDVVFDGVGGDIGAQALALVRPGGRFSAFGMASGAFAPIGNGNGAGDGAGAGVTIVRGGRLTPEHMRTLSARALALAAAGRLVATVGQTFDLHRAADAHAAIEARATIGKTLLFTQPPGSATP